MVERDANPCHNSATMACVGIGRGENGPRGGMGERLKPAVLKTVIPRKRDRGFESLSLRHKSSANRGWPGLTGRI
jgi:hypothetical protein